MHTNEMRKCGAESAQSAKEESRLIFYFALFAIFASFALAHRLDSCRFVQIRVDSCSAFLVRMMGIAMRRLLLLPVLLLMINAAPAAAAKREMDSESKAAIDRAVAAAIELRMTPGA